MPEKVQEKMPDRISDRLSHEMSEYMSYRMAAYLSLFFWSHQLPVSGDHSKNNSEIHLVVSLPLSAISLFMWPGAALRTKLRCPLSYFRHVSLGTALYVRHILHMSLTMPCKERAGLVAWMSIYTYVGTNVGQLAALMPCFVSAHMPQRKDLIVNLPDMQGETCLSVHMPDTCQ